MASQISGNCSVCSTAWSSWQHSRQPRFLHYWPFVWGIHVEWAGGFPTQRSKKACPYHYIIIVHLWWFRVTIISTHLTLFLSRSPCHIHPFDLVPMCHNRWAGNHRAAGRWSHPGWHGWDDGYKLTHKYMGICDLCRDRWASMGNKADSRFAPSQWETALLCNDISHWLGANRCLESEMGKEDGGSEWWLALGNSLCFWY